MAKIGTAHFEVKPILNREALDEVCAIITKRIAEAVNAGLRAEVNVPATEGRTHPTRGQN